MNSSNLASPDLRIPCRRGQTADRRKSHFKATIVSFFNKRRKSLRREAEDIRANYLQSYKPINWSMLLVIMLLVGFDAMISFSILFMGSDIDTAMPQLLSNHTLTVFFVAKSVFAGLIIFVAATYQNIDAFRKLSKQRLFYAITVGYLGLLFFQVSIL